MKVFILSLIYLEAPSREAIERHYEKVNLKYDW
jgi:hypothetical protein